jgi:hypothetical protein
LAYPPSGRLPHSRSKLWIIGKQAYSGREIGGVLVGIRGRKPYCTLIVHSGTWTSHFTHNEREPMAHCLKHHVSAGLTITGKNKHVGLPVESRNLSTRHTAMKDDLVVYAQLTRQFLTGLKIKAGSNDVDLYVEISEVADCSDKVACTLSPDHPTHK